jgi:hypothetical protein
MRITRILALLLVATGAAACTSLEGPSFDDPSVEELSESPNRASIAGAAIGLVAGQRGQWSGVIGTLSIWGRESYNLRPEEPRTITNNLIDPLIGSGGFWGGQYGQLQNGYVLLRAADGADASTLTDSEKAAVRGFAKTFMAQALWEVAIMHDPLAIPLDTDRAPTDELAPLVPIDQAYDYIFSLFDEGYSDLQAAGGAFPFDLPAGFSGFDTPSAFGQVNRALKVRALKYADRWSEVLTTLPSTFMNTSGDFDNGLYLDYSTQSGDASNTFFAQRGTNLFAHPRLLRDAQLQPGGSPDMRAQTKLSSVQTFTLAGITVTEQFDVYLSLADPIPLIQNEELILIRAEARLATGDMAGAIADINTIRTMSGGLDPIPGSFAGDLLGELLYNKRYSLMYEGGFTYLDARQYDRMGDTPDELPRVAENHVVYPRYPYPNSECLARGIESDPGCQPVFGS